MTTVLLLRHGTTADVGRRVSGRSAGVGLTEAGRAEARALAGALAPLDLARVYTSPIQRAIETAHEVAAAAGKPAEVEPLLMEIDFGDWTGCTFDDLDQSPAWITFNTHPEQIAIPHGEALDAVAERGVRALEAMCERDPGQLVAAVTHGDVIRLTLTRLLSMPLGAFRRVAIAPASITAIRLGGGEPVVTLLNHPPAGRLREALYSS